MTNETKLSKTQFTLRVNKELIEALKISAKRNKRSLNHEIEYRLEKSLMA